MFTFHTYASTVALKRLCMLIWAYSACLCKLLACWVFLICFVIYSFKNTFRVSAILFPGKDRHLVSPDLGPNCLQTEAKTICLIWFFTSKLSIFSDMFGWVFLGWTSTKQGLMCLVQWHWWSSNPQLLSLESRTPQLGNCVHIEPFVLSQMKLHYCINSHFFGIFDLLQSYTWAANKQKMLPMSLKRQICCWCFCWSFFMCVFVFQELHRLKFTLTDSGLHISWPSGPVIPWAINSLDFWKYKMDIHAWIEFFFSTVLYNTSCLPKRHRQKVQTKIRLLLKKQSDQGLLCFLFWQAFCELQPLFSVNALSHWSM